MKHILIVEHDSLYTEAIRSQFQPDSTAYTLTFVATLHAANEAINQQIPDLAFVSNLLPDGEGTALLSVITATARFPVIMLLEDKLLVEKILQAGALDYLLQSKIVATDMVWMARRTLREWDCIIQKQQTEQQLQQSEATFRTILESITEGIVLVRSNSTIQLANQYIETVFGYERDELVGQVIDVLLPSGYRRGHRYLRETYMQNPTPRAMGIGRDLLAQRKDGTTFSVEVSLAPVVIASEHYIMCIIVDITPRVTAQIDLQIAKQQLEAYNSLLEERVSERTTRLNQANQLLIEQVNERELAQIREREQHVLLESIHEIALAVNSSLNLNDILDRIVETLDRVVPHDHINITLINSSGLGEVVRAKGYTPQLAKLIPQGEFDTQQRLLLSELIEAGRPLILSDSKHFSEWHKPPRERLRSVIGTPIIADSKILGLILLSSERIDFFTARDTERLGVFVNHAALAIRNAQLYEAAGELAVIKDRQRLARDLHDAVTQTLFSAGVVSDSLIHLWDTQPHKVKERLVYLNQLTQGALAEMRTLLVELRPQAIAATDFDELARHLIVSFYNRTGIQPRFNIECTNQKSLSSDVKEVLYRILQESLSNITKHARAASVEINLQCLKQHVQLEVTDDGSGFDTSIMQTGTHMGLRIMQERADSIHANLMVSSESEKGTRIVVQWEGI